MSSSPPRTGDVALRRLRYLSTLIVAFMIFTCGPKMTAYWLCASAMPSFGLVILKFIANPRRTAASGSAMLRAQIAERRLPYNAAKLLCSDSHSESHPTTDQDASTHPGTITLVGGERSIGLSDRCDSNASVDQNFSTALGDEADTEDISTKLMPSHGSKITRGRSSNSKKLNPAERAFDEQITQRVLSKRKEKAKYDTYLRLRAAPTFTQEQNVELEEERVKSEVLPKLPKGWAYVLDE